MKYAVILLAITITRYYGYYFIPGVPARVAAAMGGLHVLALGITVMVLLFKRMTDWRVMIILMASLIVTLVESSLIAVCGSWYAFVYEGDPLFGDKCELMLNRPLSKPLAYTLFTIALIIIPLIWNKSWMRRA